MKKMMKAGAKGAGMKKMGMMEPMGGMPMEMPAKGKGVAMPKVKAKAVKKAPAMKKKMK